MTPRPPEWFVYIPEEGDWPILYDGNSHARARSAYLAFAQRKILPPGAIVWRRDASTSSIARIATEVSHIVASTKVHPESWLRPEFVERLVYNVTANVLTRRLLSRRKKRR